MTGISPAWLADLLAAAMLAVAACSLARPLYAGRRDRQIHLDTDATHVLLGVALAGLLAPSVSVLPHTAWAADTWAAIFAAAAVWFAWRLAAAPRAEPLRYASVLVLCAAMVFVELDPTYATSGGGMASMPGMPGMAATTSADAFRTPTLALLLAFAVTGFAVLATDRAALLAADRSTAGAADPAQSADRGLIVAPRAAIACHVAAGVVVGYLLVLMLA